MQMSFQVTEHIKKLRSISFIIYPSYFYRMYVCAYHVKPRIWKNYKSTKSFGYG